MAWRITRDPYRILVSELMLQQTQVDRVKLKYEQFLAAFPTLTSLAEADLAQVLNVWQGLGYNRRAIALKRCAEVLLSDHNGQVPDSVEILETLPGVGPYTARAIAAFAFGLAEPLIETNIRAVFIHFFFNGHEQVTDRDLQPLVAATLDRENPREWYYALMDYGAMLKRAHTNPARRSSRHVRQSPFEGSNRQLRSRILRTVLETPGLKAFDVASRVGGELEPVKNNLMAMEKEGFLECSDDGYRVRSQNGKEG